MNISTGDLLGSPEDEILSMDMDEITNEEEVASTQEGGMWYEGHMDMNWIIPSDLTIQPSDVRDRYLIS